MRITREYSFDQNTNRNILSALVGIIVQERCGKIRDYIGLKFLEIWHDSCSYKLKQNKRLNKYRHTIGTYQIQKVHYNSRHQSEKSIHGSCPFRTTVWAGRWGTNPLQCRTRTVLPESRGCTYGTKRERVNVGFYLQIQCILCYLLRNVIYPKTKVGKKKVIYGLLWCSVHVSVSYYHGIWKWWKM